MPYLLFLLFLSGMPSIAYAQTGTQGFTYARVIGILFGLVDLAFAIGLTLAVIFIVWNAIKIMTGRDVGEAKKNIWYAILGSAIIVGVNVILATIQRIVTTGTL